MNHVQPERLIAASPVFASHTPGIVVDLLAGITILLILFALSIAAALDIFPKVRLVESLSMIAPMKQSVVLQFGLTGRWPDGAGFVAEHASAEQLGSFGAELQVTNGSIHLTADIRRIMGGQVPPADFRPPATLSVIRAERQGGLSHFPVWVCGHATPPAGFATAKARNQTSIPPRYLPPACRI